MDNYKNSKIMTHLPSHSSIVPCLDSALSCSDNNGGGECIQNASHMHATCTVEIEKLLSQLKCKRAFQDPDSLNGEAAKVFSSAEVSQLLALICGVNKSELNADVRHNLKVVETLFKELIKITNVSNGMKLKEGLNELFHNPEHLVFQTSVTNEPADWAKLVLPIMLDIQRKKVLMEEIQKDIQGFQKKRREVAKDIGLEKKKIGELERLRQEKEDKMQSNNIKRLTIALESNKSDANAIEEELSKHGTTVSNDEVEDLAERFAESKSRYEKLKDELKHISADGVLPPDITEATILLENRKCYLEALLNQISNPLDVSSRRSLDNSVFLKGRKSTNI